MKVETLENKVIKQNEIVKVTEMGNVTEIQYMQKRNTKQNILMLEDGKYCELKTGEIKDCIKHEKRVDQKISLMRTFKNIRNIINANVTDTIKASWITLTYAENMTDTRQLYIDFKKYSLRFDYFCKKKGYSKPSYISIIEPQGRGAWHCHLIYIWDKAAPFIPNKELRELWQQGYVYIGKLKDVDNVGAYLTAYLADIPLNERKIAIDEEIKIVETIDENGNKKSKKYIKGGRLDYYPVGMNIFRTSRNIKRPEIEYMSYKKALKKASAPTPTFQKTIRISDVDTNFQNIITTEYYNSSRKQSK